MSEGMHTVVETFEASVGAPPPGELASEISQFVKEPDDAEKVIELHKDAGDEAASISADSTCEDKAGEGMTERVILSQSVY